MIQSTGPQFKGPSFFSVSEKTPNIAPTARTISEKTKESYPKDSYGGWHNDLASSSKTSGFRLPSSFPSLFPKTTPAVSSSSSSVPHNYQTLEQSIQNIKARRDKSVLNSNGRSPFTN